MIAEEKALEIIAKHRGDCVLVMSYVATAWPESMEGQLVLPFIGCMGKVSSFGLGLALARPDKKVVVLDGDGSLLMNLGSLVTIANMAPSNLVHFVLENEVYETTGGQPVPMAGKLNFAGFAKAAGYPKVYEIDHADKFNAQIDNILSETGPTFVWLKVTKGGKRLPIVRFLDAALAEFTANLEKSLPQA
ncbi:thiamine pyrophosphate-dependent enzyme [Chloroflexota bacterium]